MTIIGVYFYEPSVPASALIGKSPEYVAFYTDTYILKSKDLQFQYALEGCIASGVMCCMGYCLIGIASGVLRVSN